LSARVRNIALSSCVVPAAVPSCRHNQTTLSISLAERSRGLLAPARLWRHCRSEFKTDAARRCARISQSRPATEPQFRQYSRRLITLLRSIQYLTGLLGWRVRNSRMKRRGGFTLDANSSKQPRN